MDKSLKGKVALVTGGSRGIGAAIAKQLAAEGASIALTYAKDANSASVVVKDIEAAGGKAIAIQADASATEAVQGAVEKAVAALGKLDILVNNAGTAIPKPFVDTTFEEMDHVINLNIRGVFVTTQAALKQMNDNGRIIMIGSCVGERNLTPGLAAYAATKGAVKMFSQSLSREVGNRGITVNNVQPARDDRLLFQREVRQRVALSPRRTCSSTGDRNIIRRTDRTFLALWRMFRGLQVLLARRRAPNIG